MVQGVLVCGTFVTQRALIIISSLLLVVLIFGGICLSFGLTMNCGYFNGNDFYYEGCSTTKLSLTINGGVLVGFTVIGLIAAAVLSCKLKEPEVTAQQSMITQPYAVMPVHIPDNAVYPSLNPGVTLQQVNESTSAELNQVQSRQTPTSEHQKTDSEEASSSD